MQSGWLGPRLHLRGEPKPVSLLNARAIGLLGARAGGGGSGEAGRQDRGKSVFEQLLESDRNVIESYLKVIGSY